ncbi:MAG: PAS domain-containing protein [Pseudomonadota bacterium]
MNKDVSQATADVDALAEKQKLIRAVFDSAMFTLPVTVLNAVIMGALLATAAPLLPVAGWVSGVVGLALARFFYCRRRRGQTDKPGDDRDLAWIILAGVLSGALWGLSPLLPPADAPAELRFITLFMIAGTTAGASTAFAAMPRVPALFNAAALFGLGVYYVLQGGFYNYAIAGVLVIYFVTLTKLTHTNRESLLRAFRNEAEAVRQKTKIEAQTVAFRELAEHYKQTADRASAAEVALLKKTAEMQLMFEHTPARIWLKDGKNTIIRVNRAAAESMGAKVRDVEGRNAAEFFPSAADRYLEDDRAILESGESLLGAIEEYAPVNGEPGWVRVDKIPYVDPETGERRLFVFCIDVTDLRETQERLLKVNALLESVAEGRGVAVEDLTQSAEMRRAG